MREKNRDGDFRWYPGRVRPTYTNWRDDQPDRRYTQSDGVAVSSHSGKWYDVPHYRERPHVCEVPTGRG